MAFRFVAFVAALACVATANPVGYHGAAFHGCPRPALPIPAPAVVQTVVPAPAVIGPQAPGVVEHASAPYEINYFEKPWVVKHLKSAALNVFTQTPAVVDEYAAPSFSEAPAPPAVIVEPVCGSPAVINPAAGYGAGYGYGYAAAPLAAAPVVAAPAAYGYGCH